LIDDDDDHAFDDEHAFEGDGSSTAALDPDVVAAGAAADSADDADEHLSGLPASCAISCSSMTVPMPSNSASPPR
jgi:hypothetical protein